MRWPRPALLTLLVLALPAAAVAAPKRAPAPAESTGFHLPPITRYQLKSGLTVLVLPSHRLPLVDVRLVIPAGAAFDPAGREGLASLTATLLTRSAGGRTSEQVAETIDFVGGSLAASATAEQLVVRCEVLRKDFDTGLALLHDAVVSPAFDDADFQRARGEVLGAIAADHDDPGAVADRALLPFVMDDHPLGHPAEGWEASVSTIERDDVVAFHAARIRPDRAILAVVGDVNSKAALQAVEKAFGDWKASKRKETAAYPPLARDSGRRVRIVSRPEVTQTQVRMACPAVPRNHPDYYPIVVANTILGSGFTSRLMDEIRVNRGLTYDIRSRFEMDRNAGTFVISTFTGNANVRAMVDGVLDVLRTLQRDGPTPDELEKARAYLTGLFPLRLQAPDALAARIADVVFYDLPPDDLDRYAEHVRAVKMDDVRRALDAYFCVDDLDILVVSDPSTARPALEGLGPLDVVEAR
jgi:zinc protease